VDDRRDMEARKTLLRAKHTAYVTTWKESVQSKRDNEIYNMACTCPVACLRQLRILRVGISAIPGVIVGHTFLPFACTSNCGAGAVTFRCRWCLWWSRRLGLRSG